MTAPKIDRSFSLPLLAYWLVASAAVLGLVCVLGHLFPMSLSMFLVASGLLLFVQALLLYFLVISPLARARRIVNASRNLRGDSIQVRPEALTTSEVAGLCDEVTVMMESLKTAHSKDLESTRTDLMDAVSKDLQDKFVNKLSRQLSTCSSSSAVGQKIINSLENEFDNLIASCFAVRVQPPLLLDICAHSGLTESGLSNVPGNNSEWAVKLKNLQEIRGAEFKEVERLGLAGLAPKDSDTRFYQYFVAQSGESAFFLCCFIQSRDTIRRPKFERSAPRLVETCQGMVQLILRFEKEFMEARKDSLTKFSNAKCLQEFFTEFKSVEQSSDVRRTMSMVLFDCDNFMTINSTQGKTTTDSVISTMASIVSKVVPGSRNGKKKLFGDCIYRVGACKFLLVLEDTPLVKAMDIAERGRAAVEGYNAWPGGLPSLSISVAAASYPDSTQRIEDLMGEVELCIEFIHSQNESNRVISPSAVPASFKQKKQRKVLEADSEFFEPLEMFNSVSLAGKTGLLTVSEQGGRQGWIYFNEGVPEKAGCGRLLGEHAIVEIMSAFDSSTFRFQGYSELSTEQLDRISGTGLEHCTGTDIAAIQQKVAEASSHLRQSKMAITSPDLYLLPTSESQSDDLWQKLQKSVSADEIDTMKKILKLTSGSMTFKDVLGRLHDTPTYLLWRAAALLVNNKMMKFTKLKVSSGIQKLR